MLLNAAACEEHSLWNPLTKHILIHQGGGHALPVSPTPPDHPSMLTKKQTPCRTQNRSSRRAKRVPLCNVHRLRKDTQDAASSTQASPLLDERQVCN